MAAVMHPHFTLVHAGKPGIAVLTRVLAGNLYKSQRSQHVKQEIYNGKKEVFKRGFYLLGEQPGN